MGKSDLINFPDDLSCSQILTRLPLKEAIRFSAVSRKWCRAWTRLPHLKFSEEFFNSICTTPTKRKAVSELTHQNKAVDIINKIILMQCVGVETIELYNCDWCETNIHKWLLWVSLAGVKCIDFKSSGIPMEVPESIFSCVTLTSLSLKNFKMKKVPALFQGFSQLVTCYLEHVWLSEKAFEAILKLCCLIQSLTVSQCRMPSNLRVISSSLKSLALLRLSGSNCSMEANCPRLENIKIIKCSGLVIVNICLPVCVHLETDFRFLEHFVTVQSLRKITCFDDANVTYVKVLQSFPRLEELCFDCPFFASYSEDLVKLTLGLANLKTFTVNTGLYYGDSEKHYGKYGVVNLCYCVLKSAPLLKTVRIGMDCNLEMFVPDGFDHALYILNYFLSLARCFPKTKILLSRRIISPGGQYC